MELKMKYHYSYFIYPYVIKESSYNKYVQGLLRNEKCTPRFFEREKDLSVYNYFLPTIRDYMFKSFGIGRLENTYRSKLDNKLRENVFKSSPCVMFEYNIGIDAQAKTEGEDRNIL